MFNYGSRKHYPPAKTHIISKTLDLLDNIFNVTDVHVSGKQWPPGVKNAPKKRVTVDQVDSFEGELSYSFFIEVDTNETDLENIVSQIVTVVDSIYGANISATQNITSYITNDDNPTSLTAFVECTFIQKPDMIAVNEETL